MRGKRRQGSPSLLALCSCALPQPTPCPQHHTTHTSPPARPPGQRQARTGPSKTSVCGPTGAREGDSWAVLPVLALAGSPFATLPPWGLEEDPLPPGPGASFSNLARAATERSLPPKTSNWCVASARRVGRAGGSEIRAMSEHTQQIQVLQPGTPRGATRTPGLGCDGMGTEGVAWQGGGLKEGRGNMLRTGERHGDGHRLWPIGRPVGLRLDELAEQAAMPCPSALLPATGSPLLEASSWPFSGF